MPFGASVAAAAGHALGVGWATLIGVVAAVDAGESFAVAGVCVHAKGGAKGDAATNCASNVGYGSVGGAARGSLDASLLASQSDGFGAEVASCALGET